MKILIRIMLALALVTPSPILANKAPEKRLISFEATYQAVQKPLVFNTPEPIVEPAPIATPIAPEPLYQAPLHVAVAQVAVGGYEPGSCVDYVSKRRPDLPHLGNASEWLYNAQALGLATGQEPRAGAVGVEAGHVVYVESVNEDGTINLSEMNWNYVPFVVHYRTTSANEFIYVY
jgi:hypothetical protein